MGNDNAVKLMTQLRPSVIIPLMNAEIEGSGPLASLIKEVGSEEEFRQKLQNAGLSGVRVQPAAPPNMPLTIKL